VKLAREAIEVYLDRQVTVNSAPVGEKFGRKSGAFVTLNTFNSHELRGCIGFPYPDQPLVEAIVKGAIYAATQDPRFPPLSLEEFRGSITIELTVLTPPRLLTTSNRRALPDRIKIGKHGLIIEGMRRSGLLLPQVAVEWRWDAEDFLTNCCLKAGLPPDSWLLNEVTVKVFEGEIFEEVKPSGEVKRKDFGE
jgi:uncharacterized protein